MDNQLTLQQIRENERRSHIEMYTKGTLYQEGTWLSKPIKTITEQFPSFAQYSKLRVLDLGCGVGRNCIAIAEHFRDRDCSIDCVDILEFAIQKLLANAQMRNISHSIHGIVSSLDDFHISQESYDWVLDVSALEHADSEASLHSILAEIRDGIRTNGIVSLVMNSNVREFEKCSGRQVPAQFEVNMDTETLRDLLHEVFIGWQVLKATVAEQEYDIPRDSYISRLHTNVVTFVARK